MQDRVHHETIRKSAFCFGLRILAVLLGLQVFLAPAHSEEILRVPYSADIGTFDPDNGFETGALGAINSVYEGLVEYKPASTQVVGLLARNWEISNDGLTYTFHLVDGVRFHDGTALNAAAVVKSLERRRDHRMVLSYFLNNVKEIHAPDDKTVVLVLGTPQPSLLDSLASPWGPKIISPKALADHDEGDLASKWLDENADGTGPFKLAEFRRGERYVLERSDDYWGKKPFFDRIEIPVIADISQQILKLRAGEIDAVPTNYPPAQLGALPRNLEITAEPSMTQFTLFTKPGSPMDDPEIRKAVLTAINPALWIKDAFGKYASLSKSPYQNMMFGPAEPISFPTDFEAVAATLDVANIVMAVSLMSFLGLGQAAPVPELGSMTARTLDSLTAFWWLPILPAAVIFLLCLFSNMAGDGLRAALRGR